MNLSELKDKTITELNTVAKDLGVQGFGGLRKQELIFKILQAQAEKRRAHLRRGRARSACPTASASSARPTTTTSPGPDDIYVSPSADPPLRPAHRRHHLRARCGRPRTASATSRCSRSRRSTSRRPEQARDKILFDNLTPLYPMERLRLEHDAGEPDHARDGPALPHRQGPARPDRGARRAPARR